MEIRIWLIFLLHFCSSSHCFPPHSATVSLPWGAGWPLWHAQTFSRRRPLSCRERLTKHSDVTASEFQGHLKAGRWLGRQAQLWEAKLSACSGGSIKGIHFLMWSRWIDGYHSAKLPKTWIADGSVLWKSPWAGGNHPRCPFRLSPPASQRAE